MVEPVDIFLALQIPAFLFLDTLQQLFDLFDQILLCLLVEAGNLIELFGELFEERLMGRLDLVVG